MRLAIIRGLPGSGKTSTAKAVAEATGSLHFEADMFHTVNGNYLYNNKNAGDAHKWCQSQTAFNLMRGTDVIVANTFTTVEEMQPYLDMAVRYGADVEVIEMKGNFGSIHNVPEEVIDIMKNRWEEYTHEV